MTGENWKETVDGSGKHISFQKVCFNPKKC